MVMLVQHSTQTIATTTTITRIVKTFPFTVCFCPKPFMRNELINLWPCKHRCRYVCVCIYIYVYVCVSLSMYVHLQMCYACLLPLKFVVRRRDAKLGVQNSAALAPKNMQIAFIKAHSAQHFEYFRLMMIYVNAA